MQSYCREIKSGYKTSIFLRMESTWTSSRVNSAKESSGTLTRPGALGLSIADDKQISSMTKGHPPTLAPLSGSPFPTFTDLIHFQDSLHFIGHRFFSVSPGTLRRSPGFPQGGTEKTQLWSCLSGCQSLAHGCTAHIKMICSTKLASICFSQAPGISLGLSNTSLIQGTSLVSATVPTPPTSSLPDSLIRDRNWWLIITFFEFIHPVNLPENNQPKKRSPPHPCLSCDTHLISYMAWGWPALGLQVNSLFDGH